MKFTNTTGLLCFVKAHAEHDTISTIMFYFIDGYVAVWDEKPDFIKGKIAGMEDIIEFGNAGGEIVSYAYLVGDRLNIYVMYDMGV